jgi:hypothetical protein
MILAPVVQGKSLKNVVSIENRSVLGECLNQVYLYSGYTKEDR